MKTAPRHRKRNIEESVDALWQVCHQMAWKINELQREVRNRAHMAVGTDPKSPRYSRSRPKGFWANVRFEATRRGRRKMMRRSGVTSHVVRVRRFQYVRQTRGLPAAMAMMVIRYPMQYVKTFLFMVLTCLLVLAVLWFAVVRPVVAPILNFAGPGGPTPSDPFSRPGVPGGIVPGSYVVPTAGGAQACVQPAAHGANPAGGSDAVAHGFASKAREIANADVDAQDIHRWIMDTARATGRFLTIAEKAAEEAIPAPQATVSPSSYSGCGLPCTGAPSLAYAGGEGLDEAAAAIVAAGVRGEEAATFVAIAGAESEYNREARNPSSNARGYWQIMTSVHNITEAQAFDPAFAAEFAVKLKRESPKGFAGPWAETYGVGAHQRHMEHARAAVARAEGSGVAVAAAATEAECTQTPGPTGSAPTTPERQRVLQYMLAQVGDPYVWGGTGPNGFDCSGLLYAAFREAGTPLRVRTAAQMWSHSEPIDAATAQPGDILFSQFGKGRGGVPNGPGHMAIVIGGGKVVEAQRTGTFISVREMKIRGDAQVYRLKASAFAAPGSRAA